MLRLLGRIYLHWTDIINSSSLFVGADQWPGNARHSFTSAVANPSARAVSSISPSLNRQRLHPLQECERFVCLRVRMTEILREKDGAPVERPHLN